MTADGPSAQGYPPTTRGTSLPASDRLEEVRRGSFLPPPVAVRSRGSPNFLQLGNSETHACID